MLSQDSHARWKELQRCVDVRIVAAAACPRVHAWLLADSRTHLHKGAHTHRYTHTHLFTCRHAHTHTHSHAPDMPHACSLTIVNQITSFVSNTMNMTIQVSKWMPRTVPPMNVNAPACAEATVSAHQCSECPIEPIDKDVLHQV